MLLYLLFRNIWIAAAVGLLFGVHPMTVESVTWIGDRKTLLAAFFSFWSLLFYILFTRTTAKKYYAACLIAYLMALMSKPTIRSRKTPLVCVVYCLRCNNFRFAVRRGRFASGAGTAQFVKSATYYLPQHYILPLQDALACQPVFSLYISPAVCDIEL